MGGTTFDVSLIREFRPELRNKSQLHTYAVRSPSIDIDSVGAGGGSIVWIDAGGGVRIGPESAGADPGPACYGRGGTHPAVTDANLSLGRYDPGRFAGGSMKLDIAAAHDALLADVGAKLGLTAELAALGVVEMVDENMANAARVHAIESGKTYEGRTLIAFGGGGPVHACRVAEKVGITRVLVPSGAGVGSAIGFLRAPVGYEVVRSLYQRFSTFDVAAVNDLLDDMRLEAEAAVAKGSFGAPTVETRTAYMRYVGQGHEIPVPLPNHVLGAEDVALIRDRYDTEYARFFDRPVPGSDVEIMSYAVVVTTVTAGVEPPPAADRMMTTEARPVRTQPVRDTTTGAVSPWAIYDRASLAPWVSIAGPAIVAEDETSTLIGPGWNATVNGLGYIEMTRD
jgi:N-methylhydantoinase A